MLEFASYNDIVTELSFSKSSEKLDEKSLYTKLSPLLCNPLMPCTIVVHPNYRTVTKLRHKIGIH